MKSMKNENQSLPAILAPAGSRDSFLAALAAGADAVYCGLKHFSARMEAKNFSVPELARLTALAHRLGRQVFVALNTVVKPDELAAAGALIAQLERQVRADALIVQDPGIAELARQAGFSGSLHLSTLANVSFPAALRAAAQIPGVDRVVLPRELGIDEIRAMAAACPDGLDLEVFIHGALCFCVSGRCYWSSYLGGRSGLRGRCVQPCRRMFRQRADARRSFSCQDFSLDVLVRVLQQIPRVRTWKIEGRKKGPHYVYYTVRAYRMLRDEGGDPGAKKAALELLAHALGRTTTHYNFLPQRPRHPVDTGRQTGSGLFVGKTRGGGRKAILQPRRALLPGDKLRIGYEDGRGHHLYRLAKAVPAKGRFILPPSAAAGVAPGTPVFLTDRREPALDKKIAALEKQLPEMRSDASATAPLRPRLSPPAPAPHGKPLHMTVARRRPSAEKHRALGLWLDADAPPPKAGGSPAGVWWWLPPVVWPGGQERLRRTIDGLVSRGARRFMVNAPWQRTLFTDMRRLTLWAGPFCNITNALTLERLQAMGFAGAVVSPELGAADYRRLSAQSTLPLGIVISGNWPLGVSRIAPADLKAGEPFSSPRGEQAWYVRHGDLFWIFPNWRIDLEAHTEALRRMGYRLLIHLREPVPPGVKIKQRAGLWNWKLGMK